MNYGELLELLEISSPEEFEYFENVADLIECERVIGEEALTELFAQIDGSIFSELIENYFSELLEKIPDRAIDIYTLIHTIGLSLAGLAKETGVKEGNASLLAEEFDRFRRWYMFDTAAVITNLKSGECKTVPLSEALVTYRLETISGDEHDYDFENCLDYPLTEYVISLSGIAEGEYENRNREQEFYEHDGRHAGFQEEGKLYIHASEDILNDGFVYDDEFSDEC